MGQHSFKGRFNVHTAGIRHSHDASHGKHTLNTRILSIFDDTDETLYSEYGIRFKSQQS